ncbi:Crp/Fnr family transcriptional regulator [Sphingomonas aurantiaca]|uniref:Crp/Fnr family transcriptional regulator n=1 Tax=Sphingomonas aurantiaca TaxID=185949 RepID=UPI00335F3D03
MAPIDTGRLEADAWFGAVPAARRALLLAQASVRTVAAGTRLYGVGDPPDGLWAVLDGQVRLIGYPAVGAELVVLMMGPGTWFGELSTLDAGPRPHDAIAFGAARVLHIGIEAFRRLAAATPELWWDIALLACAHQRASLAFMMNTLAQPIPVRLARTLAGLARAAAGDGIALRQEDIAAMIGVSRQTLNKALKAMEREGVIALAYARIRVVDAEGLRRLGKG